MLKNLHILKYFLTSCLLWCLSCNDVPKSAHPVVRIETGYGDMDIEIYTDKAPTTAGHFLEQVKKGTYQDAVFYRVLQSDPGGSYNTGVLQGGVYGSGIERTYIPHEPTSKTGLSHTDGVVSMARLGPGTASTEFFICIGDQSSLDAGRRGTADSLGMAAFGKVIQGYQTLRAIHHEPATGDRLNKPVRINRIRVIKEPAS